MSWQLAFFLASASAASHATAQSRLYLARPFALQRGTSTAVKFSGDKLKDAYPLVSYCPDISGGTWEVSDDAKQATTEVTVAATARRGWHPVRIGTPSGFTQLRMLYVSDDKLTHESSLPHDLDQPQPIEIETLLEGRFQRDNTRDCYAVALDRGQRLSVEVQALRVGIAMFDVKLNVFDPDGNPIAECDDSSLTRQDPFVRFTAEQPGDYCIVLSETRFEGRGNYWYLLHTGSFPRPIAAQPSGGQPGTQSRITWIEADGTQLQQTVEFPNQPTGSFSVFPENEQTAAPTPVPFRVADWPMANEVEPNNAFRKPQVLEFPVALEGAIQEPRDVDHFQFAGKKGQVIELRIFARNPQRSRLDSIVNLKRSNGQFIASNDDMSGLPDSGIRFTVPEDDNYVMMIRDQRNRGGPDFVYRLEIGPPRPSLSLNLPDVARNRSAWLTIPQGNRMAALVQAKRENIGGPVQLSLPDLPDEVSAEYGELPEARYRLPVLFAASEEAPTGCHLIAIQGVIPQGDGQVAGGLHLRQLLVNGLNNREMWGADLGRLATAVTPRCPVRIDLVEPRVPLVRSGTMNLRIRATKQEGFSQPVRLRMLYNPAGVSSQDSVNLAADQEGTTLTLTANDKAPPGEWPIVVIGETQFEDRPCSISTQLCPLTIADKYFDLGFPQATIERGQSSSLEVNVTYKEDFPEPARAELIGLPAGVKSEPLEFAHGQPTLIFHIEAAENARLGRHQGVTCRITIVRDEEPITHVLGRGQLRVDAPLATKLTNN